MRELATILARAVFAAAVLAIVALVLIWVGFRLLELDVVHAAPCTPDVTHGTPTPTMQWTQASGAGGTVLYRVRWRHSDDATWQGAVDIPAWPGDGNSAGVWPGITTHVPLQRIVPTSEQGVLIDLEVWAVDAQGHESANVSPSILRLCMTQIWPGRGTAYQ